MLLLEKEEDDKKLIANIKNNVVKSMQDYHKNMKAAKFNSAHSNLESVRNSIKDLERAISTIEKEDALKSFKISAKALLDMVTSIGVNSLNNPSFFSFGTKTALLSNKELLFVAPNSLLKDLGGSKGGLVANDYAKIVYRSVAILIDLNEELKDTVEMGDKQYQDTLRILGKECKEIRAIIEHMNRKIKEITNMSRGYTESTEDKIFREWHEGKLSSYQMIRDIYESRT